MGWEWQDETYPGSDAVGEPEPCFPLNKEQQIECPSIVFVYKPDDDTFDYDLVKFLGVSDMGVYSLNCVWLMPELL